MWNLYTNAITVFNYNLTVVQINPAILDKNLL